MYRHKSALLKGLKFLNFAATFVAICVLSANSDRRWPKEFHISSVVMSPDGCQLIAEVIEYEFDGSGRFGNPRATEEESFCWTLLPSEGRRLSDSL